MREVLDYYAAKIAASTVINRLKLTPEGYFIVSAHREENVDDARNLTDLLSSLAALAKRYRKRIVVSTHPRTRKRLSAIKKSRMPVGVEFMRPLGFADYVQLQKQAYCVLSDSGTLTEESGILGFPGVMLRQAHERPEGMDQGTVIMSGLTPARVLDAVKLAVAQLDKDASRFTPPADYAPDDVSRKVVRIILSYIDFVNRTVWFR
jgi:UDP-N-acetylglucosamine 2-epimerase (non-hydrolysing)